MEGCRVGGRIAELALKASLETGLLGLGVGDLPSTIQVTLDEPRGNCCVQVHHADREMGLAVAKHVRSKLHAAGWAMLRAIVKEEDVNGNLLGEHDAVVDKILGSSGPRGLVSLELKCRRLYSPAGRSSVRTALRTEEVRRFKNLPSVGAASSILPLMPKARRRCCGVCCFVRFLVGRHDMFPFLILHRVHDVHSWGSHMIQVLGPTPAMFWFGDFSEGLRWKRAIGGELLWSDILLLGAVAWWCWWLSTGLGLWPTHMLSGRPWAVVGSLSGIGRRVRCQSQ